MKSSSLIINNTEVINLLNIQMQFLNFQKCYEQLLQFDLITQTI